MEASDGSDPLEAVPGLAGNGHGGCRAVLVSFGWSIAISWI